VSPDLIADRRGISRVTGFSPRRRWAEFRYRRLLRRLAGPRLLDTFAAIYETPFFVEIGANDGVQHDFLRDHILAKGWRGIMIEPVPYVYERLRQNYAEVPGVMLENIAISDQDGTLPFYHLIKPDPAETASLPDWYDGIGSFSKETILSHRNDIPDLDERIVELQIPAMTFESLLRAREVDRVDLLMIDTEGYDGEIVRHLDLATRAPAVLIYEHFHLAPDERAACRGVLEDAGYATMEEGFDTFAVHAQAEPRLRTEFGRLRPAVAGVSKHDEGGA
jgi:FkbM family methyltransferase